MNMDKSWVFFSGTAQATMEDLRRYIESHFRGYVLARLEQQIQDEKLLLQKLAELVTPYQLIVSNVGVLVSDLRRLVDDDVTRKYAKYMEILDAVLEEKYDIAEWPAIGFLAVLEDVYDVTVYVVVADFDENTLRLIELRDARLKQVEDP
jgi:hypothetical protein